MSNDQQRKEDSAFHCFRLQLSIRPTRNNSHRRWTAYGDLLLKRGKLVYWTLVQYTEVALSNRLVE